MQPTETRIWLKNADLLLLLLGTWCYACHSISALTQPDQGAFAAFGYHLLQGKTLYVDFFDHKPPAIYLLNAAFMGIGGVSENAIGWFILFFCLLQVIIFYRLLQLLGFSRAAVLGLSICFITVFFRYNLFGTGNFTEQYGVLCTTAALLFYLRFQQTYNYKQLLISASFWGMAFSFKEPFLLSAFPTIAMILFGSSTKQNRLKSTGLFLAGFTIPLLLQFLWLWQSGAWSGYYHHLQHSVKYTTQGEPLWLKITQYPEYFFQWFSPEQAITMALYLLAIPGIFLTEAPKKIIWLLLGQQCCDYMGTSLTGNGWHHYYLQSTPIMVIVIGWGISGYFRWFNGRLWTDKLGLSAITLAGLLCWQIKPWQSLAKGPEKNRYDEIERYLNKENLKRPVNLALAREEFGFYYVQLQGLSPLRYIVPYPYHWVITKEKEKQAFLHAEYERFIKHPPEYIITGTEFAQAWIDAGMDSLTMKDYTRVSGSILPDGRDVFLLKRK